MEKVMKNKKFSRLFPFFRIYNEMSGSIGFKTRLFLAFILIAVPILTAMCIGSFFVLRASTEESIQKSQATELERINTRLLYIISDTENISREFIFTRAIQDIMIDCYEGEQYPEDSNVMYTVNSFIANRDYVDCIVLTGMDRTIFSTERAFTNISAFENIQKKWWYEDLISTSNSYKWYSYSALDKDSYQDEYGDPDSRQKNALMLARPIYSMDDYKTQLGYMMIYLDESYIENILNSITYGDTTNIFLLDKDGQILAGNQKGKDYSGILKDIPIQTGSAIEPWNGKNYVISCSDIALNKWKICMVTPYHEVDSSVSVLKIELSIMVIVVILILFLVARYSAGNMAKPIITLSKMMDSYHGRDQEIDSRSLTFYEKRTDEIGQIYRSYEQLEDRINRLIKEIYVKNLEKKDAELALLQSQINPHFLYNTLDSINWIALANDQDEISEMITALSDTFRLSLMKNNSSFVEMSQEIQYIQSYLVLQQFRYGDRLSYEFDIPETLPKLYIPRFILQPVIENALKHGINNIENGGKILIQLVIDEQINITVTNDGNDIDLEKMKGLLVFDPMESDILNFKKDGYGVQNIHRRIKIICGDAYGLSYEKTETQTICRIVLPVKEEL